MVVGPPWINHPASAAFIASTWLFGFLALIGELSWAWYPFIILNSSQALWIAATFLLTKKVINLYISGFNSHKLKSEETQISKQKLNGNSSHNS